MTALVSKSLLLEADLLESGPSAWVGHIPFAFWIIEKLQPRILVELGTHYGHSYFSFCQSVQANGLSTKCYAVDTWQGDEHAGFYGEEVFAHVEERNQHHYHAFSRLLRMRFDDALSYFSDGTIDLLHIDGLHTYEAVRHDFETWLPKLSSHGVVLFHDINVQERGFGVWRLWEELSKSYPHIEFEHSHGLGVLFVGEVQPPGIIELLEEWPAPEGRYLVKYLFAKLGHLVALEYQLAGLSQSLAERDGQIAGLSQSLAERDAQIISLNRGIAERDGQIAAILSSTSWRLTRPLRLVGDQIKRTRYLLRIIPQLIAQKGGIWRTCAAVIRVYRREGFAGIKHRIKQLQTGSQLWIAKNEPNPVALKRQRQESLFFKYRPKISIITPVWNPEPRWLKSAIESVINQTYDNWELCLADGNSTKPQVKKILKKYAKNDSRIKLKLLADNKGIAENTNEALLLATGEFIGLLDHDDELAHFALYEVVKLLNKNPEVDFIYSDEDKINEDGMRFGAYYKPDWSPEYFLAMMYTCHLGIYRTKIVREIGGFRPEFDGAQDYDMVLRLISRTRKIEHIPSVLYHWRAWGGSTAKTLASKVYAEDAARRALHDYLLLNNLKGQVLPGPYPGHHRVKFELMDMPLVSIIIPTANQDIEISEVKENLLDKCINSIREVSTYTNFEIVVVHNGNLTAQQQTYMDDLGIKTVFYAHEEFNLSEKINIGCRLSQGEHLIILNDDVRPISPEWIESMLEFSQLPEIGVVGAKLYFPDHRLQHVGVHILNGNPGHPYYGAPEKTNGYGLTAKVTKNYLAVTGACMMTRKQIFELLGGYNRIFPINYNDVDYCLRVHEAGYRIVYTPYAKLYHFEGVSKSGGRSVTPEEIDKFHKIWYKKISMDPYYNPNLSPYVPYEMHL